MYQSAENWHQEQPAHLPGVFGGPSQPVPFDLTQHIPHAIFFYLLNLKRIEQHRLLSFITLDMKQGVSFLQLPNSI